MNKQQTTKTTTNQTYDSKMYDHLHQEALWLDFFAKAPPERYAIVIHTVDHKNLRLTNT